MNKLSFIPVKYYIKNENLQQKDLEKLLVRLAEKKNDKYVICRKTTPRELAQFIGATSESVSRLLSRLEEDNKIDIVNSRKIVINNILEV